MKVYQNPRMVIFGEKECCALCLAFEKNRTAINEFLKDFVPDRTIELCQKILNFTSKLGWVPEAEAHKTVYREIAGMEIERLKKIISTEDYLLDCGCWVQAHIEILQKVVKLMGSSSASA